LFESRSPPEKPIVAVEPPPVVAPPLIPEPELAEVLRPATVAPDPATLHRRAVLMLLATGDPVELGGVLIKWVEWHPVAIAGCAA
jgi:hypothetical protein